MNFDHLIVSFYILPVRQNFQIPNFPATAGFAVFVYDIPGAFRPLIWAMSKYVTPKASDADKIQNIANNRHAPFSSFYFFHLTGVPMPLNPGQVKNRNNTFFDSGGRHG